MEDPVRDIGPVILKLTKGSPKVQEETIKQYFTPNASFKHPFCSVQGNRAVILCIFQWYKILSPQIQLQINSIAFDESNLVLYVNITQVFRIWLVPFYRAPVTLTTILQLESQETSTVFKLADVNAIARRKYYIQSQNDLYQVDQSIRFLLPWGIGTTIVMLWHFFATLACILGAYIFAPVTWFLQETSKPDQLTNMQQQFPPGPNGVPPALPDRPA